MKISPQSMTSGIMALTFAAFAAVALGFDGKAKLMPLLVAVPGLLLCAVQFAKDLRRSPTDATEASLLSRNEIVLAIWLFATTVVIVLLGFTWGAPAMVAFYFHVMQRKRLLLSITCALGCYAVLEIGLNEFLNAQLFEGLLPMMVQNSWVQN